MYYFIEISCVIAEMWMVHMFLESLNGKDHRSLIPGPVVYSLFFGALAILSLLPNMAFARLTTTFLGVWAVSMFVFRSKLWKGILSGIAYCAIVGVNDVLTAAAFQACGVSASAFMSDHAYRGVFVITGNLFLFGIILILCMIGKKGRNRLSVKLLLPVLPCWLISILLCLLFTWQCIIEGTPWHPMFLLVLMGLLYTNIIMIYFTNKTAQQAQFKKDLEIAEHHYAMERKYYEHLQAQQEETHALRHDMSKYLRALQIDPSHSAFAEMKEKLDSISQVVDVGNTVVSVILNEYFQKAKTAEISIEPDILIPDTLFITAADLYILLGNTLDNAIEACCELPSEARHIAIKLKLHNSILFYEISNPYTDAYLERPRRPYHGYGLKNVAKCVEKYHGNLSVSKDAHIFRVIAHINSPTPS